MRRRSIIFCCVMVIYVFIVVVFLYLPLLASISSTTQFLSVIKTIPSSMKIALAIWANTYSESGYTNRCAYSAFRQVKSDRSKTYRFSYVKCHCLSF